MNTPDTNTVRPVILPPAADPTTDHRAISEAEALEAAIATSNAACDRALAEKNAALPMGTRLARIAALF